MLDEIWLVHKFYNQNPTLKQHFFHKSNMACATS
jgi:hypothetical protein